MNESLWFYAGARQDGRMTNESGSFETALTEALSRWGMPITSDQLAQMRAHFDAVVEINRVMNLTRITDPKEAATKHYADSLALLLWIDERRISVRSVLDIGTGGGFPAIPLAITRPDWSITAIDGAGKKVDFVRRTARTIGVDNLHCIHTHSCHWTDTTKSDQPSAVSFDLVVCRALATLPNVMEQSALFVEPGGYLVAYQSDNIDQATLEAANRAAKSAGLKTKTPYRYSLGSGSDERRRALYPYQMVI